MLSCANINGSYGGNPYGDIKFPSDFGSGGGNASGYVGGSGGGIINVTILNSFQFFGYLIV